MTSRYVTIMLIPDGTENRRGFRVQRWVFNLVLVSVAALVIGIVMFFAFYGAVVARAARTEQLEKENEQLTRYRAKVLLLQENMEQVREVVTRLTKLAGIEYEFPELPPDSELFAARDAGVSHAGDSGAAQSAKKHINMSQSSLLPTGLPVKGPVVRQFQIGETAAKYHPGVDIACSPGTGVLATASGRVLYSGVDSTYGTMVVLRHNDSISTVYGKLDELRVSTGDLVAVGDTVALSGAAFGSTAPYVYYEVRMHNEPINPLENLYASKKE